MTALSILLIIIFSACGTGSDLEKRVVEFQLDNGMKWLLVKKGYAPLFAGVVQIKAGGADEVTGKTGIAHLLEHMAFKGTPDISPDQLWDIFTRNGVENLNAYTSKDVTTYHAEMPNSKLELWIFITSEMISKMSFRDLDPEKMVVLEEMRMSSEDSPEGQLFDKLTAEAYQKSSYAWPTIGTAIDVAALTKDDVEGFYKGKYTPECMYGAIVGNIDIAEAKEYIKKYFGKLERKNQICEREVRLDPPQEKLLEKTVKYDSEPLIAMAFHKPTVPNFDDYIFDLFSNILCEGESSRMTKNLVREKRLAKRVSCFNSYPGSRFPNLFVVYAEPLKVEEMGKLKDAILNELETLKSYPVSFMELEKAKNQMKAGFLAGIDTNFELANTLVDYENLTGNWRYIIDHAKNIDDINIEDITRSAERYFRPENMTVIELER